MEIIELVESKHLTLTNKDELIQTKSKLVIVALNKLIWEQVEKTMIENKNHSLRLITDTLFFKMVITQREREVYQMMKMRLIIDKISTLMLRKHESLMT